MLTECSGHTHLEIWCLMFDITHMNSTKVYFPVTKHYKTYSIYIK